MVKSPPFFTRAAPLQLLALRSQLLGRLLHGQRGAHEALGGVLVEAVQAEGVEVPGRPAAPGSAGQRRAAPRWLKTGEGTKGWRVWEKVFEKMFGDVIVK